MLQLGTGRAPRLFANRLMLWLGARSYSFYLVHIWVLLELDHVLGDGESLATRVGDHGRDRLAADDARVGALSYRYVERPFLERKTHDAARGRRGRRPGRPRAGALSALPRRGRSRVR